MSDYLVSARKYRPASFGSVVGQKALTTTLKNAIQSERLASSYLFCGPRGVGKTTCARIFAKTINCLSRKADGEACGECESCRSFNEELRSYNVFELDAASNNSVDDIRELTTQVNIPPMDARYKVYIIDEVHMLSSSAFNAFLKTLEEPPKYAIFILATTEKHKILPTILSRCQTFDFNRISVQDIIDHLQEVAAKEGIETSSDALAVIAEKADGGMRDALSTFDQVTSFTNGKVTYQNTINNLNVIDYNHYFTFTEYFLEKNYEDSMLLLNELLQKGFECSHIISGLMGHIRNLMVSRTPKTAVLLNTSPELGKRYHEQAMKCSVKYLLRALKLTNECELNYRVSKNKRLLVELTLLQLAQESDDTDSSCGPGPAKVLQPIFNQAPKTPAAPKPAVTAHQQIKEELKPDRTNEKPQTGPESEPHVKIVSPQAETPSATPAMPKLPKMSGLNIKFKNRSGGPQTPENAESSSSSLTDPTRQARNLTEENLLYYWQQYAEKLPSRENALIKRMFNTTPQLISDTEFKIVVPNKLMAADYSEVKQSILNSMIEALNNPRINMVIEVAEHPLEQRILNKYEIYETMKGKNGHLAELESLLNLELQ